jgi:hypothetical protein
MPQAPTSGVHGTAGPDIAANLALFAASADTGKLAP